MYIIKWLSTWSSVAERHQDVNMSIEKMQKKSRFFKSPRGCSNKKKQYKKIRAEGERIMRERRLAEERKEQAYLDRCLKKRMEHTKRLIALADAVVAEDEENAPIVIAERYGASVDSAVWLNEHKKHAVKVESKMIKLLRWLCK